MFYWPVSGGGFIHKKTQENGILRWTSCGEKIRSRKAGSAMLDLDKAFSFRAKNYGAIIDSTIQDVLI